MLAFGAASEAELVAIIRRCSVLPVQFYAVPRFFELGVSASNVGHEVDGFALVPCAARATATRCGRPSGRST